MISGTVVFGWEKYFAGGRVFSSTSDRIHFLSRAVSALACFRVDVSTCDSVEMPIGSICLIRNENSWLAVGSEG